MCVRVCVCVHLMYCSYAWMCVCAIAFLYVSEYVACVCVACVPDVDVCVFVVSIGAYARVFFLLYMSPTTKQLLIITFTV